jgi:hypothetical protein
MKLEKGNTYKIKHIVPHYIPEEQQEKYLLMKYLAKKEEKNDMVKKFAVPAEEHSVSMHTPSHIPISQSITYLQKRKEREKNDLHEQS